MRPNLEPKFIINSAINLLNKPLTYVSTANQGADHMVIKVVDENNIPLIIKTGPDAATDFAVLKLLTLEDIKVPKVYAETTINVDSAIYSLVVMSCFSGHMSRDVSVDVFLKNVPSIIGELSKVHNVETSSFAGHYLERDTNNTQWSEFLLKNSIESSDIGWAEVLSSDQVDPELIRRAIAKIKKAALRLDPKIKLGMINTDVNRSNIFILNEQLEGIIDWSDTIFGDPLFDFARFRMALTHSEDPRLITEYYRVLNLSLEQLKREELYFLINITEYVGRYYHYKVDKMVQVQQKILRSLDI